MNALAAAVASALGRATGAPITIHRRRPLGGGSINHTEVIETTAGTFVLKSNRHGNPAMFRAEADGLAALRASGTSLAIPEVVAVGNDTTPFLLLEYLEAGPRTRNFDEALGRGLAELHRTTNPLFGFDDDNFCGATPQPNPWTGRWIDFYAESRLGHQLRLASDSGFVSASDRAAIEALIAKLGSVIDEPASGPSLIHGDLWSGNLHRNTGGHPALIDPAPSFSHREAELGMMTLFGGFSDRVFAAYDEAFPLEPGWLERNDIYQLYHVMNHLNLFGDGYHAKMMTTVKKHT